MKKLLALVLCIVMLCSISVSAFAIADISGAYAGMNCLYNAYGNLAGAVTYVHAVNMVRALILDPDWNIDGSEMDPARFLNGAVSYEGLFALVGPTIYAAYDAAGTIMADLIGVALGLDAFVVDVAASASIAAVSPDWDNPYLA